MINLGTKGGIYVTIDMDFDEARLYLSSTTTLEGKTQDGKKVIIEGSEICFIEEF